MTTRVLTGHVLDQLATLPPGSAQTCCTSPPYFGLRAYGTAPQVWGGDPAWRGELGSEPTVGLYIDHLVQVFRAVWRVLRDDGTCFLNIADSYAGSGKGPSNSLSPKAAQIGPSALQKRNPAQFAKGQAPTAWVPVEPGCKAKSLYLVPERLAIALSDDGWYVRSRIAWVKTSCMPESVTDRPTSSWEHVWLLTKRPRYFWDAAAVRTPLTDSTITRVSQNDGHPVYEGERQRAYPGTPQALDIQRMAPLAGANMRNAWILGPEPYAEAHFATYPSEIPRRAILAGTPERGSCAACGAPWRRLVERTAMVVLPSDRQAALEAQGIRTTTSGTMVPAPSSRTTGWEPGCGCGAGVVPAVVLDPFLGSGTTAVAAAQLGRDCIGVELNPEYVGLAATRVQTEGAPLFSALEVSA